MKQNLYIYLYEYVSLSYENHNNIQSFLFDLAGFPSVLNCIISNKRIARISL